MYSLRKLKVLILVPKLYYIVMNFINKYNNILPFICTTDQLHKLLTTEKDENFMNT